ncbi:MAG: hypothetical protein DCC75_11635 [Proteobacteria bacterium]|nr:MAG: hypothetical protein DCC75_11635 [Pseudomonadota bacterium]
MPICYGMVHTAPSSKYTPYALRSFFQYTELKPGDDLFLIDNDGSLEPGSTASQQLSLLVNAAPKSFAQNINQIMVKAGESKADLVFLNNDIIFTPNWLAPLLTGLPIITNSISNQHARYSAASWKLEPAMDLEEYLGHEHDLLQIAATHAASKHGLRQVLTCPFFCVCIPYQVYSELGAFDESFGKGGAEDRDYSLRAYLRGFGVFLALDSFVLHFMGKSTWRGAESAGETEQRNRQYIERFQEKWGERLTKIAVLNDQIALSELAAQHPQQLKIGAFAPIIQKISAKENKAIAEGWRPKVGAVCVIYDDTRWLRQVIEAAYPYCDSFIFLVSNKPWNGEVFDNSSTLGLLESLPDLDGKIEVIRGGWSTETEQRNEGLEILNQRGIDYCLILDADEIYDTKQLAALLELAASKRYVQAWRINLITYWKSPDYRIDPPESFQPVVLAKVGEATFVDKREISPAFSLSVPREICVCHHLSYARSDEEVKRKISSFSHSHQLVDGWYEKVWLGWDENHGLEDLHPCWPTAYKRAVRQPPDSLPAVLRK